jgi:hypothetical protein
MRHAPSTLQHSHTYRPSAPAGAIEWEELPSLAACVRASEAGVPASTCWDNTCPAPFDAAPPSQPFREPVQGLAMREVNEPDIFRHFFGR